MPEQTTYREKDLILPALYVIAQKGSATTSELIGALTALLQPTGHDALIIANRRDTYFSQKVRNLVSHRSSNGMLQWTDFIDGCYTLTVEGAALVEHSREALDTLFARPMAPAARTAVGNKLTQAHGRRPLLYDEDVTVSEGALLTRATPSRQRSARLRQAAIRHYTQPDGSIRCAVCGFDFRAVYGELGEGYIQIHHEHPLFQYEDEGIEAFLPQAVAQVKPLCANCHCMIHRPKGAPLSVDELTALLQRG